MQTILEKYAQLEKPFDLIVDLVEAIRPKHAQDKHSAVNAIIALTHLLGQSSQHASLLRNALFTLFNAHSSTSLLADLGIQPHTGFFSEMKRRIAHKILPAAINTKYLKDLFALIFHETDDEIWVQAIPDEVWANLLHTLQFQTVASTQTHAGFAICKEALEVLAYRLAASGLEQELHSAYPDLGDYDSPFISQHKEIAELAVTASDYAEQVNQIQVMLDQCQQVIVKIRRNSAQTGTSIRLTFLLQIMSQQIARMRLLLELLKGFQQVDASVEASVRLLKTLVSAECHKNDVAQYWRENVEILALRVTENASRTGEHYITQNRAEYFALMRSAMGAGVMIALMAMVKIMVSHLHLAPLTEAIIYSLNYGIGFMLIHILHFTVATKQPAMTAAAIAASIDESDGKSASLDKLVTLIAQTIRSQVAAIFGNVSVAIPTAMAIAYGIFILTGQHFVGQEKAHHLIYSDIHPLYSGALMYAAIAGVCLFLSGQIAGYHDNIAVYNKMGQRLKALSWMQTILGVNRLNKVADYIENNLGALAGNFYFGCLLGGMAGLGVLLGVPIDIRHIAFSSAFVGFSIVGLDFNLTFNMLLLAFISILLIGIVNLGVSFGLALYVAMRSRKLTFAQWPGLIYLVLSRLNHQPGEFMLAPKHNQLDEPVATHH